MNNNQITRFYSCFSSRVYIYYLIYTLFESVVNKYGQFLKFNLAYLGM